LRGGLMTWVDLVVLAVLALSALLAFMRGLVREVLGLGAWVAAVAAAVWALPRVRPQFARWIGASPWVDPVALGAVFLATLIVLIIISRWISALVRASPMGGLDRTLGLVFGLVRGAALLVFAYYIVGGWIERPAQWPEPVREALAPRAAYVGAYWLWQRLPENFRPKEPEPPPGRATTAEALLHANPQGRAVGRPPVRD
jgi:membrane protein required for colicin V production